MKAKSILTALFLAITNLLASQTAPLNQFDSQGKKDGKWLVYLDQDWKRVDDSTQALYYRYTYYDHGVNIYPMGPCGRKGYKLEPGAATGKPVRLDGEYKWYDAKGRLSSVHAFQNGEYIFCKEYFPTGELQQYFNYTKKCEGQEHGWTLTVYDKKGNIKLVSPTCKDEKGNWPLMRD